MDKSKLKVLGSVCVTLHYKKNEFIYEALVCSDVGDIMLGGNPFLEQGIIPNPVDKCVEVRSQYGLPEFLPWRTDIATSLESSVGGAFLLRAADYVKSKGVRLVMRNNFMIILFHIFAEVLYEANIIEQEQWLPGEYQLASLNFGSLDSHEAFEVK